MSVHPARFGPREINDACRRFEKAHRAGLRPRVEDYLADAPEQARPALLAELRPLEEELRREAAPPQEATLPGGRAVEHDLDRPRRIAGIEVVGVLGRGAMGVVYKGFDPALKRFVALKVVRDAEAQPDAFLRVRREAEAVARLSHPNIVRIHAVAEHDRLPVLVLEFVEGRPLDRVLGGGPVSASAAAKWVAAMARAMAHAHEHGVLHRDLKPANVLMENDATPRVGDFGLARELGAAATATVVAGTPSYMAPEQAAGRIADLCPATDVHALGAIFYECLVGRPPFRGEDVMATLQQVMTLDPVPPRRLNPAVPRDAETICLKCLRKDPAKRYATAAALADDLAAFLDGGPIKARPVGVGERLWKTVRRYPVVSSLVALVLVTVTAGVLLTVHQANLAEAARREAVTNAALAESRLARTALERGVSLCEAGEVRSGLREMEEALRAAGRAGAADLETPIRVNLASWRPALSEPAGEVDHAARSRASDLTAGLAGFGRLRCMAVCPASGRLATGDDFGTVMLWEADGRPRGRPLSPFRFEIRAVSALAFSPDGAVLVTANTIGEVRRWDVAAGTQSGKTLTHPGGDVWCVAFSPDGSYFVTGGSDGKARRHRTADGSPIDPPMDCSKTAAVYALAFHPKEPNMLYAGTRDGYLQTWDAAAGRQVVPPIFVEPFGVHSLAVSADGSTLIYGGDRGARLSDAPYPRLRPEILPHLGRVDGVALSPDGRMAATAGHDGQLRFWRAADGRPVGEAVRGNTRLNDVAFTPDGSRVVSCEHHGVVRFRHPPADNCEYSSPRFPQPLKSLRPAGSPDAFLAVTPRAATLIDARSPGPGPDFAPKRLSGLRRAAAALGRLGAVARAGRDGVELFDADRPAWTPKAIRHPNAIVEVGLSPDGRAVYVREADEPRPGAGLRRWEVADPAKATWHVRGVRSFAVSPDGSRVLAGFDGRADVLGGATGEAVGPDLPHPEPVSACAWHESGRLVATGSLDGGVRVFTAEGVPVGPTAFHRSAVLSVTFGDEGTVLTASADGSARWWDVATGLPLGRPMMHGGAVVDAVPASGGVLSAGEDGRLRRWATLTPPVP